MSYMLTFQELREGSLSFLVPVLSVISELNVYVLPIVIAMVYWAYRKDWGISMFFSFTMSNFTANGIKSVMKVPRPYFRRPALHIDPFIETSATGYSFPSGHATAATAGWGHFAMLLKKRWFTIVAIIYILLSCFARVFLGAHTIQDVVCGISQTILVILLVDTISEYLAKHPDKYMLFAILLVIVSTVVTFVIAFTYPDINTDAEADSMISDVFSSYGMILGVAIGWVADKKWINMPDASNKKERIIRCVLGGIAFAVYYLFLSNLIISSMDIRLGAFIRNFTTLLLVTIILPYIFKRIHK